MSLEIFVYKCKREDYLRRKENPDAVGWMCLESYFAGLDFPMPMDLKPKMTEEQQAAHSCQYVTTCLGEQIYNWLIHNTDMELDYAEHIIFEEEKIVKLRNICSEVFENAFDKEGEVNEDLCRELLPNLGDYYFSYDDGYGYEYVDDVYQAREVLSQLLESTDFATELVLVKGSW